MKAWSHDLRVEQRPGWMIELAAQVKLIEPELLRGPLSLSVVSGW